MRDTLGDVEDDRRKASGREVDFLMIRYRADVAVIVISEKFDKRAQDFCLKRPKMPCTNFKPCLKNPKYTFKCLQQYQLQTRQGGRKSNPGKGRSSREDDIRQYMN